MKVLFVDDDAQTRFQTSLVVESLGHTVTAYSDASQALEAMQAQPNLCDCLMLDRNMPGLDGISLIKQLKQSHTLRHVPIIMLTSAASAEEIAEGLAAGAQIYLAKPAPKKLLTAALNQVRSELIRAEEISSYLNYTRGALALMRFMEFELKSPHQARQLAAVLATLTNDPDSTSTGYWELLINAIEHGNLEITYDEKTRLLEENQFEAEVERRLGLPQYLNRVVKVTARRDEFGVVTVDIEDEGKGFDWKPYMEFCADRAFDLHGRGIAMTNHLSFNELSYLGRGNHVRVVYRNAETVTKRNMLLEDLMV